MTEQTEQNGQTIDLTPSREGYASIRAALAASVAENERIIRQLANMLDADEGTILDRAFNEAERAFDLLFDGVCALDEALGALYECKVNANLEMQASIDEIDAYLDGPTLCNACGAVRITMGNVSKVCHEHGCPNARKGK